MNHGTSGSPKGSLQARDTAIGTWNADLENCLSGAREHFFGVDLFSADHSSELRVVVDAMGRSEIRVRDLENPQRALLLNRDNCPTFAVGLRHTNWHFREFREVQGSIQIECELETGGVVTAVAEFSNCY